MIRIHPPPRLLRRLAPVLALALALRAAPAGALETTPPPAILIECGGLFDGVSDRVTGPTRVLVRGATIEAVGPGIEPPGGAERLDLRAFTLLPGFIDAHTHLSFLWPDTTSPPNYFADWFGSPALVALAAAKNAERTLLAGFTTIREMGCEDGIDVAVSRGIARGFATGPRVVTSGPIYPPLGTGRRDLVTPPDGTARTRDEIVRKTRDHLGAGCDWIKIYATGGTFDDTTAAPYFTSEEMEAAVEVAAPREKWVAAHAMGVEGARRAVRAGVRSLEHGSRLDDATAREMARRGVWLVPTLYHLDWYARHGEGLGYAPGYAERLAALQKEQFASLALARKAGVKIACGSDAVYTMHGENAMELVWLVRAGLTPVEALRAATSGNAELLGLGARLGRVAPGWAADLIAVPGDPSKEIGVVTRVAFVMKDGVTVARP